MFYTWFEKHEKKSFSFLYADRLPYSIRILLESAIRNCDNFQVTKEDVEKIIDWENTSSKQVEIPFKPARVLLQVCNIDPLFFGPKVELIHYPQDIMFSLMKEF